MLRSLSIRDFVIVDQLELEFHAGFGALTGETGAGKSILLDALGLALGDKGEAAMVRSGCERAQVVADFDLPASAELRQWLDEQGLQAEEDNLLLRRTIDAGGRSRSWINGTSVSLAQLRTVAGWLADIHGQHAHHALLKSAAQRNLLDTQAGAQALAAEVGECFRRWQQCQRQREQAEADVALHARERELLSWQLEELQGVAVETEAAWAEQWAELNAEHSRLAHAASLLDGADDALAALGEGDHATSSVLHRLQGRLTQLLDIDPVLGESCELLASAAIQLDECVHSLRRYRERLELEPARLGELEQRIGTLTDLARKHRVTVEELPALRAQWQARLEVLEAGFDPARLAAAEAAAEAAYRQAAAALSALRAPAAAALGAEVSAAMQTLAMAGGRFEIALEAGTPSAHGDEEIEFRVAANAGQPLRSLAKVASGGELSRIGLAIQVIASRSADIPTLIFDEVDVGIGGGVAEIVGTLLARLGEHRQVMCVTHLPQVAACASWQWRIAKREQGGETLSEVSVLDEAARVEEIARMLGGVNITATTRQHAAEMLAGRQRGGEQARS